MRSARIRGQGEDSFLVIYYSLIYIDFNLDFNLCIYCLPFKQLLTAFQSRIIKTPQKQTPHDKRALVSGSSFYRKAITAIKMFLY